MSIYRMRTEFGKYLKPLLIVIAAVFLVGAIWSFGVAPGGQQKRGFGKDIVATVNGMEIPREEFEVVWQKASEDAREQGMRSPLQHADLKANTFVQLVNSKLILSAAKGMGVDVSDRKVKEEVDKMVVQYLKQNRDVVLGKLGKDREKVDPRNDREYKRELATIGSSVSQQEDFARTRIPVDQIRAQLAGQGIQKKLKEGIKRVTDDDIRASYNVYKVRQIVLMKSSLPAEQVAAIAQKIVDQARKGADFVKLANENSQEPGKNKGSLVDYSFDNRWMFPPEAQAAIARLKPGQVTSPITAPYGTVIVKLEGVSPNLPKKLDYKTMKARRQAIQQDQEMRAGMAFYSKFRENRRVDVRDPELRAYWRMFEAQSEPGNQASQMKMITMATADLKVAIGARPDNTIASAKLAQLLRDQGKTKEAITLLYPMLEGENASVEGADLRVLLGDLLIEQSKKDKPADKQESIAKAIEQYKIASEISRNDPNIHQQLITKYQQLERPDLVSIEQSWMADFKKRSEELKALQAKTGKPGKPAPRPVE